MGVILTILDTVPETNSSPMKITIFPSKYHQNGGFFMAMLVSGRVTGMILQVVVWKGMVDVDIVHFQAQLRRTYPDLAPVRVCSPDSISLQPTDQS